MWEAWWPRGYRAGLLNLGVNVLDKFQNHFVERYSKYFNSMINAIDFRELNDQEISAYHSN